MFKNTENGYGLIAISVHWLVAIVIIGMFALGLWMVGLDYYSEWYKTGPNIHRSTGVLLALVMVFRFTFKLLNATPKALPGSKPWEHRIAVTVHRLFYFLFLLITIAGYLISTADGRPVDVFGWFEIPATITFIENQEDIAGDFHYYLALSLIILASIHGLAALKHHFIDKDATLIRMLRVQHNTPKTNDSGD